MDELIDFLKNDFSRMASWFQFQKRKAIKESCCYGPSLSLN